MRLPEIINSSCHKENKYTSSSRSSISQRLEGRNGIAGRYQFLGIVFCRKLHENEKKKEIGREGVHVPRAPRSATDFK